MKNSDRAENLNHAELDFNFHSFMNDEYEHLKRLSDPKAISSDGLTRAYFRDLEAHLTEHIRQADVVVGCVAWLTSKTILSELAAKATAIVVQKEDFLRPDKGAGTHWQKELRKQYNALKFPYDRWDPALEDTVLRLQNMHGSSEIKPVRCMGSHNESKSPAHPRVHHKFLVFCKEVKIEHDARPATGKGFFSRATPAYTQISFKPYAVWTGSFNMTYNATLSLENAIYSEDVNLAAAYFSEWAQIEAFSEPLDWEHAWVAPEHRIGT